MAKLHNIKYNPELPEEISVDEPSVDEAVELPLLSEDPRLKIITLYNQIRLLKDVSSKFLIELKQCRKSVCDANVVVGELNGNIKKFQ